MEKRFYTQSVPFLFSSWTCREYDSMLNLINVWIPVLPEWILENIKQQLILPRLQVRIRAIFIFVDRIFFIGVCLNQIFFYLEEPFRNTRLILLSQRSNSSPAEENTCCCHESTREMTWLTFFCNISGRSRCLESINRHCSCSCLDSSLASSYGYVHLLNFFFIANSVS